MELYSPPVTRAKSRKLGHTFVNGDTTKLKSRTFDVISDSKAATPATVICEVKKVKLSKDEMEMNGAPAGDIFDVKVLLEGELTAVVHPEMHVESSLAALKLTTSTWADRYAAIEILRRLAQFNPLLMTDHVIGETMIALSAELDSLRSCTIRNSVLCLQAVLPLEAFKEWILSEEKSLIFEEIVGKLLLKSCSGPKFLCKVMAEVLLLAAKALPYLRLVTTMLSFTNHKNSEVSNQVYAIVCDNFMCQLDAMMAASNESSESTIEISLRLFQKGLSSVKPTGREMARRALRGYAKRAGSELFAQRVAQLFTPDQCCEVDREVKRPAGKSGDKGVSARVPLRTLPVSACANTITEARSGETEAGSVLKPWARKRTSGHEGRAAGGVKGLLAN